MALMSIKQILVQYNEIQNSSVLSRTVGLAVIINCHHQLFTNLEQGSFMKLNIRFSLCYYCTTGYIHNNILHRGRAMFFFQAN
jgi:hypothetical protein